MYGGLWYGVEIPVNVGIVGDLLAPVFAEVVALAALVANFTNEVVRKEG